MPSALSDAHTRTYTAGTQPCPQLRLHCNAGGKSRPARHQPRRCGVAPAPSQQQQAPRPTTRTRLQALVTRPTTPTATPPVVPPERSSHDRSHTCDYVVVGSGIGGLCCAALLARYGYDVTVVESHYLPGGAAHSFEVGGYKFDAGPSFHLGLSDPPGQGSNPLKQVLDLLGERIECAQYDKWIVYTPQGSFPCITDAAAYATLIRQQGGEAALKQWRQLEQAMKPLQRGAALFPAAAVRGDLGFALTAARFFGPGMLQMGLIANQLTGPFSALVDKHVTDPWLRSFIDLECFVLSGMTAQDTIAAQMAFMYEERGAGRSSIDYPMGGSESIINALVRGLEKHGGRLQLRSHVDQILMQDGKAAGVRLRPRGSNNGSNNSNDSNGGDGSSGSRGSSSDRPEVIRARRGVISNASVWDTQKLLPRGLPNSSKGTQEWRAKSAATPMVNSFVHLHLGIDATGLDPDLECHHLVVNQWDDLHAPQNVCIASIPTVFDPAMAPPGKAVVHAYTAANEPYALWEGLKQDKAAYKQLKEERSQCLWEALERFIPDIRERSELTMIGTPLTHERFLRRHRGSYGPAISARTGSFPGPTTPVPGLHVCGDSCMPGIGVPAAAASGMITANSIAPVWSHLKLLDAMAL